MKLPPKPRKVWKPGENKKAGELGAFQQLYILNPVAKGFCRSG